MDKYWFSKHWFTVTALVLGFSYNIICIKYTETFTAVSAAYVTLIITGLSWHLERKREEVATENQLLMMLVKNVQPKFKNVVWKKRFEFIHETIEGLKLGSIALSSDELETYTREVLNFVVRQSNGPIQYLATHIVNDEIYLKIWGEEFKDDKSMRKFVNAQRDILNNNGELVRVFIITKKYLKRNFEEFNSMLHFHDSYYKGTRNKIKTLIYFPSATDNFEHDFTIVNKDFVFEWKRSFDEDFGYSGGHCYISGDKVRFIDLFEKFKEAAFTIEELQQFKSS